jgi:hypothetical protein
VDLRTTQARCPQAPQAQQQQKKRTFDVLQNPDIITRYGQPLLLRCIVQCTYSGLILAARTTFPTCRFHLQSAWRSPHSNRQAMCREKRPRIQPGPKCRGALVSFPGVPTGRLECLRARGRDLDGRLLRLWPHTDCPLRGRRWVLDPLSCADRAPQAVQRRCAREHELRDRDLECEAAGQTRLWPKVPHPAWLSEVFSFHFSVLFNPTRQRARVRKVAEWIELPFEIFGS